MIKRRHEATRKLDPGMKTDDVSEKSLRSSAKSVGLESGCKRLTKSLISMRNRRRLSTLPCKIPLRTDLGEEKELPSFTVTVLPESQAWSFPEIP